MAQILETGHEPEAQLEPLACRPEDYYEDIAHLQLTQEQADEMLLTLWQMMSTMVNIGWGVDTLQMILPDLFESEAAAPENTD